MRVRCCSEWYMPFPGLLNMHCMSGGEAGGWVLAGVSQLTQRGVLLQSANRDKKSDIRNPSGKRSVKRSLAACPCLVLSPWKFRLIIHRNPTQGILQLEQNCNLITSKNQFLLTISMATSVPATTLPGEHLCSLKSMAHAPESYCYGIPC